MRVAPSPEIRSARSEVEARLDAVDEIRLECRRQVDPVLVDLDDLDARLQIEHDRGPIRVVERAQLVPESLAYRLAERATDVDNVTVTDEAIHAIDGGPRPIRV